MALGGRVVACGYRNLVSRYPLRLVTESLGLSGLVGFMRRWLLVSRSGLPARLARPVWLHDLALGVTLAALCGALVAGWVGVATFAALTLAIGCLGDILLHQELGGAPVPVKWWWVSLLMALLGPFAFASLLFGRRAGRAAGVGRQASPEPRTSSTIARASSWICARWSRPRKLSA